MKIQHAILASLACALAAGAQAGEHLVSQKNKAFSQTSIKVKAGESVRFVNDDAFSHNVFSLSEAKSFDLGTYAKGGAKSVTFDKPGKVEVECAIHPDMRMTVEVTK